MIRDYRRSFNNPTTTRSVSHFDSHQWLKNVTVPHWRLVRPLLC